MSDPRLIPLRGRDGSARAFALVDPSDHAALAARSWRFHKQGYAVSGSGAELVYMHRVILGLVAGNGFQADHVNRNRLDNRRANLRVVAAAENTQNLAAYRGGTSEHRGVCFDRRLRRWRAYGCIGTVQHNLGVFASEEDAAAAAAAWRAEHMPFAEEALA